MKGTRIKSVKGLMKYRGKAVYVTVWGRYSPVAFLLNFQARKLQEWLDRGWIRTQGGAK